MLNLCLLLSTTVLGQSVDEIFKKVEKAYATTDYALSFSMVEIDADGKKSSGTGKVVKQGDSFYSFFEGQHVLRTLNKLVVVNEIDQTVYVMQLTEQNTNGNEPNAQVEQLLKLGQNTKLLEETNTHWVYQVSIYANYVKTIKLTINKKSYRYDKMEFDYMESTADEEMKIDKSIYTYTAFSKAKGEQLLLESNYITKTKSKGKTNYVPSGRFKNFSIQTQL